MGQTLGKEFQKARRYSVWNRLETQETDELERQKNFSRPPSISELQESTKFNRKELQVLYRGFKKNCPKGLVTIQEFEEIFSSYFFYGNPGIYARLVFNAFDEDKKGVVSFQDFAKGVSILWRGKTIEKLEWIFDIYDCQQRGYITKPDMLRVVKAIYDLIGPNPEPPVDPDDIMNHVHHIFEKMDKNKDGKISLEEFLELCEKDTAVIESLELLNTIWVV